VPPDCRLNATLVAANLAGDMEGRRRLLLHGAATLVGGRAAHPILNPNP
jgi:hypothetical protein